MHNFLVTFLKQYYNFHLLLTSPKWTLEQLYLKQLQIRKFNVWYIICFTINSCGKLILKTLTINWFTVKLRYLYFSKFRIKLFCGSGETLSKSQELEFVELVVDGKARQVLILNNKACFLSLNEKVLLISLSNSLTWTNSRVSLFNHFICSIFIQLHYFHMILVSMYEVDFLGQIHLKTEPHFLKELHHYH